MADNLEGPIPGKPGIGGAAPDNGVAVERREAQPYVIGRARLASGHPG
jgi:hypothetical protein